MNIMALIWELTVGRLVLDLPKEDLETINEMIKRNLESKQNACVQQKDNLTDEL